MKITLKQLRDAGACKEQYDLFRSLRLHQCDITLKDCLTHASDFTWGLAARRLLPPGALRKFDRARAPAYREFIRICATGSWRDCVAAKARFHRAEASAFFGLYEKHQGKQK